MKSKSVLAVTAALSLGLFAAPFAHASKRSELAYVESYRGRTDGPAPIAVITPGVASEHIGTRVELVFVVDPTGRPVDITARTPADDELVADLAAAVAQWKFAPARDVDGRPVATRVVLPMVVVDPDDPTTVALR